MTDPIWKENVTIMKQFFFFTFHFQGGFSGQRNKDFDYIDI